MRQWVLGVDLGTSFSAGAVAADDSVELLEVGGDRRMPSAVVLTEEGKLLAGAYAQRTIGRLPDRAERNPKRYVGRAPMLLGGQSVTAVDALAALLELFVHEARRHQDGTEPAMIVLTHPVAWTDAQRGVLREAAERVLPDTEVALLAEPVAAAVHYVHDRGQPDDGRTGQVAVYDLGGGTFDTAVLTADREAFRVVGRPGGDPEIGGEAFDQLVYQHFGAQLEHAAPDWWRDVQSNPDRRWLAAATDLLSEARIAKESLSEYETASQYIPGADTDVELSRAELEQLIGGDIRRTLRLLDETIEVAGGELRGVFLTGGASRTPLVEQTLRGSYDGLVRTWKDPKTVVAMGAARFGMRRLLDEVKPPPPTAAPPASAPAPFETLVDEVLDARPAAGAIYTWSVPDGPTGPHRIARFDPGSGRIEREIVFRQLSGWALSDAGVVVAERDERGARCHVLGVDLAVRYTVGLPAGPDPVLIADRDLAWVLLRSPTTRPVARDLGIPWGEVGELAVQVLRLGWGPAGPPGRPVLLGPVAYWYIDEDGRQRRLLDPSAPTTGVPAAAGDGSSCAMVIGRLHGEHESRRRRRDLPSGPHQLIGLIGPAGAFSPIAEQRVRGADTVWVHQILSFDQIHPWLLSTSVGLETFGDPRLERDRRLFHGRPVAGAARWVRAGRWAYGVAVEQTLPGAGLSLHVLDQGRRRDLGGWPSLLGSLTSVRPDDAPRIRVDGEQIWVGAGDGEGGSHLVLADPGASRVVASAEGWLEPIGRFGPAVLAVHAPDSPPGDARLQPGRLVRLAG